MNRVVILLTLLLISMSALVHAEWMSDVDKKYKKSNAALYARVATAEALIDDANGRREIDGQALAILQAALEADPKFAPAYVQIARVTSNLGFQGNFGPKGASTYDADALRAQENYLKKALRLEPNYDYAIAMLGFSKMHQGNLYEAEEYFKRAKKLKSGYPFLKSQMAQLEIMKGDFKKALVLATAGYEQNKSNARISAGAITQLIFVHEASGWDSNDEIERLQKTRTKIAPQVAWYWGDHASFRLFHFGDYEAAIQYGEKSLSLMDYEVGRRTLAAAYYAKWADFENRKLQGSEADDAWRKAEKLYPLSLGMVNQFLGNPALTMRGVALAKKLKPGIDATPVPGKTI